MEPEVWEPGTCPNDVGGSWGLETWLLNACSPQASAAWDLGAGLELLLLRSAQT